MTRDLTSDISDETLMAFADGELDAVTQARVEQALAGDDGLAARLAVFLDSRTLVASTMKPLADEAIPAALSASVAAAIAAAKGATRPEGGTVVDFRPKGAAAKPARSVSPRTLAPWTMVLAASVTGLVVGLGGFLFGQSTAGGPDQRMAALHEALETLPSGANRVLDGKGENLHVIASFRDGEGHLCREYEVKAPDTVTVAVACHGAAGWQTRLALSNPVAAGYVPASAPETVDAFLAGIGAGLPLSVEDEAADMGAVRKK